MLVGLLFRPMTSRPASPPAPPPFFFSPPPHATSVASAQAIATVANWRIFIVLLLRCRVYKTGAGDQFAVGSRQLTGAVKQTPANCKLLTANLYHAPACCLED